MLAAAFAGAAAGTPGAVLVGGEAGAGKSRLVAEFTAQVRDRALVLAGGCVDLGGPSLPYAPFVTALIDLVRQRGTAEVAALLPGNGQEQLARLLPQLGGPAADGDPETARGRLFGSLMLMLEQLAGERPLVLIIEDLHWADGSTAELLAFLARTLRRAPVLLVATFRSEEPGGFPALQRLVGELSRMSGSVRLELPPLSRGEVAAQLEGILGRPAEPAVTSAVYQRGGGNPLFTEALLTSGGTVSARLPGSLRELLLSKVQELPGQAQQVLRAAAVGGPRVGHGLLAAVTGQGDTALNAALRPAVSVGVLVADPDGGYAFRHELFRAALLEDLLPGERVQAHRAFAAALRSDPALSPGQLPSVQLAVHWQGAGEHERALQAAWTAAAEAGRTLAYAEQLQMLELVMKLWKRAPDAAAPIGADRADLAETAASAARLAGEPARGLVLLESALRELDLAGDPERAASLLRLRAALRQQLLLPGQFDDLQTALRLAARPTRVRAQVLSQLIGHLWLRDRNDEARPLAEELQTLAERLGDEEYQIDAQIRLIRLAGHGADIIPVMAEAATAARRIGSGRLEVLARDGITDTLEARGDHAAAIRAGREDLARARQLGLSRYGTAPVAGNLAESLTSAGLWDEAVGVIEEGLALDPAPFVRWFLLARRADIAVARGEDETATRLLHELRLLSAGEAETHRVLPLARLDIELRLLQGDLGGAVSVAGTVSGMPSGDPRYLWPLLTAAMSACADAAGSPMPPDMPDALIRLAENAALPGPVELAHAAVFTAEAAGAHGQPGRTAWDAAAAAWEKTGQPYPLARALLRAAGRAAAEGDRDAATVRLTRAAELAGRLGARPLLQQITQLARRAKIRLPGAAAGPAAPSGLTARELEVLRLVATGQSNQQIAAELFISPKTASVHVSNILGKLGVTTRVAAASTAHRLRLVDPE